MKRTTALAFIAAAAATPQLATAQTLPSLSAAGVPEDSATPVLYGVQSGAFKRAGINVDITPQGSGAAVTADVTSVNVVCSTRTYAIGGSVSGLAGGANGVVQEVGVRPHPELDRLRIGQRRQPVHRHDPPEGAGPRKHGVLAAGNEATHQRAYAIRADDEVGFGRAPISEGEADGTALIGQLDQPVPQMQPGAAKPAVQDTLEIGAMNAEIGRAAEFLITQVLVHRMRCDSACISPKVTGWPSFTLPTSPIRMR